MISYYRGRRLRSILVILMLAGFLAPWMSSCSVENWGNTPHYLTEYGQSPGPVPLLGSGYIKPEVYFGFEVVWIYLIGWFHYFGLHTFFFPVGIGAFLVVIYCLLSLAIFFYGNAIKNRTLKWAKAVGIFSMIGMVSGGINLLQDFYLWNSIGYGITFLSLILSVIFEFKGFDSEELGAVGNPSLWFRTSAALIVCGLFLPIPFLLPPRTWSPPSDCEVLNGFVVPAEKWAVIDEAALEAWISMSPHFDNLTEKGPFDNATFNNVDYRLVWNGYGHKGHYRAEFTDHYLRTIRVSHKTSIDSALECFGEPEVYLAILHDNGGCSSCRLDSLLIQLWYPSQGIVLDFLQVDHVQSVEINGQLKLERIYFVEPGSIETIANRANLLTSSELNFIKPWPGLPQDIQVTTITK